MGDWLLHHRHADVQEIAALAPAEPWRAGSAEAPWVLHHLDGRTRSMPGSELRCVLGFAGLRCRRHVGGTRLTCDPR